VSCRSIHRVTEVKRRAAAFERQLADGPGCGKAARAGGRALIVRKMQASDRPVATDPHDHVEVVSLSQKLDPHVLVMQSTQDWAADYATNGLDGARDRRILVQ
jgi:hypothetical protein